MAAAASDSGEDGDLQEIHEPDFLGELFNINLVPSDLFLKFRKQTEGFRVGLNFKFCNVPTNEYQAAVVLKPMASNKRWKFVYEPLHGDIQLLSKKIPLTKYLNIQIGLCHSFHSNATGWKWNLSTCLGGDGVSHIRNKSSLGLCRGVDLRIGWRADYIPPEIEGEVSTAESVLNMKHGHLHASIDRFEAIFTSTN
ncbi:uncharacterized protein LOC122051537 [Zingiber officinale]|uniref:DUF7781 domain-containing protein n=1 Tax=Zingiber officinale TaxID=94328 RepID=A0A8J5HFA6_ZINOF|nr:uncharacterized protein LOC122051537 [Zingiber officinale]KAG6520583.1 hypothetical protein ZIOFF_017642 [Zingiber officinale]